MEATHKGVHLCRSNLNDLVVTVEVLEQLCPLRQVLHALGTHHGDAGSHSHHDIRVVNWRTLGTRLERDELVPGLLGPLLRHLEVASL